MDIDFLHEFLDLSDTCNYRESADNRFISAATLSKHIKKMELELGGQLFDRTTHAVSLSKYGEILLPYARQITDLYGSFLRELQAVQAADNDRLCVGFLPMLGRFGVLEFLASFASAHPEVNLDIVEDISLEEALLNRKFHFVFVDSYGPQNPHIRKLLFRTDHMVAVIPGTHPLAGRESVTLEDLHGEAFVLQADDEGRLTMTSRKFLTCCREQGFHARVLATIRYINTILGFVGQGKGIGILYHAEIQGHLPPDCAAVRIEPTIPFDVCVSYLPDRARSEGARQFLDSLKALPDFRQLR